jgi:hypothetical protein
MITPAAAAATAAAAAASFLHRSMVARVLNSSVGHLREKSDVNHTALTAVAAAAPAATSLIVPLQHEHTCVQQHWPHAREV